MGATVFVVIVVAAVFVVVVLRCRRCPSTARVAFFVATRAATVSALSVVVAVGTVIALLLPARCKRHRQSSSLIPSTPYSLHRPETQISNWQCLRYRPPPRLSGEPPPTDAARRGDK